MRHRSLILPLVPAALMTLAALFLPTTFESKAVHIVVVAAVAYLATYFPTPVWLAVIIAFFALLIDSVGHKATGICTLVLGLAVLLGPITRRLDRGVTKPPMSGIKN